MDKFTQLVYDLNNGVLGLTHIQNAIRAHIRERKDIPEGIKDLLAGGKGLGGSTNPGLVYHQFSIIKGTIGALELAYRRGEQKDV